MHVGKNSVGVYDETSYIQFSSACWKHRSRRKKNEKESYKGIYIPIFFVFVNKMCSSICFFVFAREYRDSIVGVYGSSLSLRSWFVI